MPSDDPLRFSDDPEHSLDSIDAAQQGLVQLIDRMEALVVGQRPLLERLVIALLAGGHVLIEGVPGLAKTRAVRALAQALDLPFRRIQFTPDLLPADLTGTQIYRPATGTFDVRPGPIVTSVLLADEINRAPAKVQSALLEAMQEGQITVGDETIVLPETFWVLATQNPIEHEGTYPLPEAQLDRFLMKLVVGYPDRASELTMLDLPSVSDATRPDSDTRTSEEPPLFGPADVIAFRALAASIRIAPAIKEYIVDLVRATRDPAASRSAAGPACWSWVPAREPPSPWCAPPVATPSWPAATSSRPTTSRAWHATSCGTGSWSASRPTPRVSPPTISFSASSTTSPSPDSEPDPWRATTRDANRSRHRLSAASEGGATGAW